MGERKEREREREREREKSEGCFLWLGEVVRGFLPREEDVFCTVWGCVAENRGFNGKCNFQKYHIAKSVHLSHETQNVLNRSCYRNC
jgi:hypothetical protein